MENFTRFDIIFVCLLFLFFIHGWMKGFLRSLVGPLAFCVFIVFGIISYDLNQNIVKSLFVVFAGTLVFSLIVGLLFHWLRPDKDEKTTQKAPLPGKVFGGLISAAWKGGFTAILILLVTLMPTGNIASLQAVQESIVASRTYSFLELYFLQRFRPARNVMTTLTALRDPIEIQRWESTQEYKDFMSDPKIRTLLTDADLNAQIKEKNYRVLMTEPKIVKILQDEELMKKFTRLAERIYEEKKLKDDDVRITPSSKEPVKPLPH